MIKKKIPYPVLMIYWHNVNETNTLMLLRYMCLYYLGSLADRKNVIVKRDDKRANGRLLWNTLCAFFGIYSFGG